MRRALVLAGLVAAVAASAAFSAPASAAPVLSPVWGNNAVVQRGQPIVVEGTARVTVGEEVRLVTENQSVYIPLGSRHRLENPGKLPMVLIEVQTGPYLGEDDIVRFEDVYARG